MIRSARGIELTAAGRVFLDHARLALAQVDAAGVAARRAAQPAKPSFALGFLTGHEIDWLAEAIASFETNSPTSRSHLEPVFPGPRDALARGALDVAFLRPETQTTNLVFKLVTKEPLVVVLQAITALALRRSIHENSRRAFISCEDAPVCGWSSTIT